MTSNMFEMSATQELVYRLKSSFKYELLNTFSSGSLKEPKWRGFDPDPLAWTTLILAGLMVTPNRPTAEMPSCCFYILRIQVPRPDHLTPNVKENWTTTFQHFSGGAIRPAVGLLSALMIDSQEQTSQS